MRHAFFIVGPTATGKSQLAADVAHELSAEIVSADAFQIYDGLDLLTAKPEAAALAKAPHHLIGSVPLTEEMNAEKYRRAAMRAIEDISSRGKLAIVVGGTGLYVKALTHGLAPLPESDPKLRAKLNAMSLDDLCSQLAELDPETARKIDMKNRRRVVRALEISLLTGKPVSTQRLRWGSGAGNPACVPTAGRPFREVSAYRVQDVLSFATGMSFTTESIDEWKQYLSAVRRRGTRGRSDECDCVADDRFARNPGTARWKKITQAVHRGNSAGDSPLRQKAVDLVSTPN